ncbi:hypothetical protein [Achromobacter denitrificans]|uniref:hypothetical protein n=1 Tax=Achromobacter denitrificans TaxID=32002 RepID=UPI0023E7AEAF|nr:hypothetical protein [Achromobacter denitrificans]MDF3850662.1 hypothetical protein [Achromobacter denitrificans]
MNPADAEARIREDLDSNVEILSACLSILSSITHAQACDLRRISFAAIGRMAGLQSAEDSLPVITYLTGDRLPILEAQFSYIADDEEEIIPNEVVRNVMAGAAFYSPWTGEVVPNALDHIYTHFVISDKAKQLIGAAR